MAGSSSAPKILKKKDILLKRSTLSKIILNLLRLLILVILIGFFGGVVKTFMDLQMIFHDSVEETLRQLILNVIILLAVVEVIRTLVSYLNEGRVRVTFVIDTILIVMLNEVLSTWFKHPGFEQIVLLCLVIVVLFLVRILAIKYSPDNE